MRIRKFGLLLCSLLAASLLQAQERARPETHQELWLSAGVKSRPMFLKELIGKDIAKRIGTSAAVGYRSADAFFAGRQVYLDLAADYELNKHMELGGEYRYAYRTEGADRERLSALFRYKTSIERFDLDYRFQYQHNFVPFGRAREVLRNRFGLGYNIPKWKLDPAFSVEFFTWAGYEGMVYFGTRYKLGTDWSPWKGHTFDLNLVYDRERSVYAPEYRVIFSVGYTMNLRKI